MIIYIIIILLIVTICLLFYYIDKLNKQIQKINYFIVQILKDNKKVYPNQEQIDNFINSIYN